MRDTIRLFRREGIPGSDIPEFPSPGTVHRAYAGGQGWRTGLLITALLLFCAFFLPGPIITLHNQKLSYQGIILIRQSFIVPLLFCKIVPNSAPIVPDTPYSGRFASRGASRLVRPEKGNKNGPMSKLTGPYFIPFYGVLNFYISY